jgi:predicted amidohydrolase YtcJ
LQSVAEPAAQIKAPGIDRLARGGSTMCIVCKPLSYGGPQATRRQFMAGAVATAGLYAAAQVIGSAPAVAQGASADLIIENAKIITLDPRNPQAEALAITGTTITAVGPRRDLERHRGPQTRIVDAGGRTVVPGLNDSHTHFIRGGLTYSQELRWDGVPSLALALTMLRQQAQRTPAPHWVQVVGGWTGAQFAEKRLPTLAEINAATGEVPCFIMHIYDRAFLNRAALRVLGYGKETPDPNGGLLERDEQGQPTGMVVNLRNIGSLLGIFARVPKLAEDQQILSTRLFMRELNRLGVTSVIDAGGGGQPYPEAYQAIGRLAADKALDLRISYSLFAQRPGLEIEDYRNWTGQVKAGQGDDYFRLMGAGEYMIWAAHDQANFAKEILPVPDGTTDRLAEAVKLVVAQGWPFRLHANYDVTVRRILDSLEKAHRDVPIDKVRWAIDHAETISPESLERVAKLGGSVAIQNRMSLDGDAFAAKWGTEAAADAPPIGRIRQMGVPLAAGTDGNRAASHNPWVGIQWLVTGATAGGTRLNAERNRLDRTEALRLYSAAGARLSRGEDRKGMLAPNMWADLAVLSDDYMTIPEERIAQVSSVLTLVGGRAVHGEGAFAALAPPAPVAASDWLPVGHFPSYSRAEAPAPVRHASLGSAAAPWQETGTGGFCLCALI